MKNYYGRKKSLDSFEYEPQDRGYDTECEDGEKCLPEPDSRPLPCGEIRLNRVRHADCVGAFDVSRVIADRLPIDRVPVFAEDGVGAFGDEHAVRDVNAVTLHLRYAYAVRAHRFHRDVDRP